MLTSLFGYVILRLQSHPKKENEMKLKLKKIVCLILCGLVACMCSSCFRNAISYETNTPESSEEITESSLETSREDSEETTESVTEKPKPLDYYLSTQDPHTHTPVISVPSTGIAYQTNGNGTCYVSGLGSCKDSVVIISGISPDGDLVTGIGKSAFKNCTAIAQIVLPSTIQTIGSYAFSGCSALVDVNIPGSVVSIGKNAFEFCTKLSTITLPESLKYLGEYAFFRCETLESVVISDQIETIGIDIFDECVRLKNVTYSGTKQQWILLSVNSQFGCISGYSVICSDGEIRFAKG